jgi:hypothetical protein
MKNAFQNVKKFEGKFLDVIIVCLLIKCCGEKTFFVACEHKMSQDIFSRIFRHFEAFWPVGASTVLHP